MFHKCKILSSLCILISLFCFGYAYEHSDVGSNASPYSENLFNSSPMQSGESAIGENIWRKIFLNVATSYNPELFQNTRVSRSFENKPQIEEHEIQMDSKFNQGQAMTQQDNSSPSIHNVPDQNDLKHGDIWKKETNIPEISSKHTLQNLINVLQNHHEDNDVESSKNVQEYVTGNNKNDEWKLSSQAANKEAPKNSILNNVEGDNWKSMAITVFCGTSGSISTRAHQVINSLDSAYPLNDWVVFVGNEKNYWAYQYTSWAALDKRKLCGNFDLVVFGRKRKYCRKSTDKAAHLLQQGALADAKNAIQARDLMVKRQGTYDLSYDLIMVYPSSGGASWYYIGYPQCYDYQYRNGFISLWSGYATD